MNTTIAAENTLEGVKRGLEGAEEYICDQKTVIESIQDEQQKEKKNKKKYGQGKGTLGQYQIQKHSHYRRPKRREKEKGVENCLKQ